MQWTFVKHVGDPVTWVSCISNGQVRNKQMLFVCSKLNDHNNQLPMTKAIYNCYILNIEYYDVFNHF